MEQTAARSLIISIDAFNNAVVDIDSVAGVLRILARLDFAAPVSGEAAFVVPNGFSHIIYASVEKTMALAPMFDQFLPRAAHVGDPSLFLGRGASCNDSQKDDTSKFLFHHPICLAETTHLSRGVGWFRQQYLDPASHLVLVVKIFFSERLCQVLLLEGNKHDFHDDHEKDGDNQADQRT